MPEKAIPPHILIVDDNPTNLKLAGDLLEFADYEVERATSAEAALELIQKRAPALILLDIGLPGMDGLELARRLRADPATGAIKIVAMTAYAMTGDEQRARDAGCNGYITKPIDTRRLPQQVAEFLEGTVEPEALRRVLIVDDVESHRKLLRVQLESEGLSILEAHDGVEALALLEREQVDALITDILMPNMDGYRLCHEVRKRAKLSKLPVIVYTNTYTSESDKDLALKIGADRFLRKPCPTNVLLAALQAAAKEAKQRSPIEPDAPEEADILKAYSTRLIAKLEERNEEHLRQTAALRVSEERFRQLTAFGQYALARVEIQELLDEAAALVERALRVNQSAIFQFEHAANHFSLAAGRGWPENMSGNARFAAEATWHPGCVLHTRSAIVASDLRNDGRCVAPPLQPAGVIAGAIGVLIGSAETPWGVLAAYTDAPRQFSNDELHFVQAIANILAAAMAQRTANQRVKESEQRLSSIIASAMDGIITIDEQHRITLFNQAAEQIFGRSAREMIGHSIDPLLPERYRAAHRAHIDHFGRTNTTRRAMGSLGSIYGLRADGEEFPIEASISQIQVAGQRLYTVIVRDVTLRRRAELEIKSLTEDLERRVQERTSELEAANQQLEAFSYSVSHDLRAPLRAINGFVKILEDEIGPALTPSTERYIKIIVDNSERMNTLIDGLLAFAHIDRIGIEWSNVDMAALAQEAFDETREGEAARDIRFRLAALDPARGDPLLLRQVWINLLSNALKYSRARPHSEVEVGSRADASEVLYWVKDNGAGFDPKYAGQLFGVFQRLHAQTEFEGTGVGLALTRRILEKHSGRIWAESALDQGATFYFTLPKA